MVLRPYKDAPGCQLCLTEWPSPVDYLPEDVVPKVVCQALGGSSVEIICEQTHVSNSHEPGIGCCNNVNMVDYELYGMNNANLEFGTVWICKMAYLPISDVSQL